MKLFKHLFLFICFFQESNKTLSLFPNPTTSDLNLRLNGWEDEAIHIQVFNNLGQLILERQYEELPLGNISLQASELSPGIYWLRTNSKDAPAIVEKFVKE